MNRMLTSLAVGAALVSLTAVASAQMDHSGGHGSHAAGEMSAASQTYVKAMDDMDSAMDAMTMTSKPGADFALMMIPHHQSAIDMAKAYLESGESDPELTKLSQEIIAAQESEIAFLKDWLMRNGH